MSSASWRRAALVLAGLACALPSLAASLQISPVSIQFRAAQGASGINLQNDGDAALVGQVRIYLWEQRAGQDVLTPATDVVASPPVMEVAAHSTQVIRLVRRNPVPAAGEQSYRVLIDEIPRSEAAAGGVAIRLQYSVPAFVQGNDPQAAPRLSWTLFRRDGAWMLRVQNDGALHAQIGAALLHANGKEYALSKGLLGYALAGRMREWRLSVDGNVELGAPGAALAIDATVNTQALAASAIVDRQ